VLPRPEDYIVLEPKWQLLLHEPVEPIADGVFQNFPVNSGILEKSIALSIRRVGFPAGWNQFFELKGKLDNPGESKPQSRATG
jgi:hypothetical protein